MASIIPEIFRLRIPLEEIRDATNNFSDKRIIGKGDFGNVYRGKMEHRGETIKIAARRLDRRNGLGDVEFWKEVSALYSLQKWECIVNMIGFCAEKDEKIIINQRYPKGSLQMHISDPAFTWHQRFYFAFDLLKGIYTIHNELGSEYIIHGNINSSTIVVDDHWCPRICGFEFSIKNPVEQRNRVILSGAVGTKGYVDPGIDKYGGVTQKSDIYSLGVVLFELLCGRKAFEENMLLAPLAKDHYEKGTLKEITHPHLRNQRKPRKKFKFYSKLAFSCLNEEPTERPDAKELYDQLYAEFFSQDRLLEKVLSNNLRLMQKSSWDDKKLGRLEHLRIVPKVCDSPDTRQSRRQSAGYLQKKIIEFYGSKGRHTVAVKTIRPRATSYLREIEILGRCKHPNIQSFLGFSYEDSNLKLIYEYVSFKYLDEFLEDGNLTWGNLLKICVGVAKGLVYLHNGMEDQKMVIHGDISSRNIELDDITGAKIVNFEKSQLLSSNQRDALCGCTRLQSNPDKLKANLDVYSFGVVMLEILCGRPGSQLRDRHHPRRWPEKEEIKKMLATGIKEENYGSNLFITKGPNKDSLDTFINLTYRCLAETWNQRPNMKVVLEELHKALSFHENHKDPLRMSFDDIKSATQNFDPANCIGGGGFGLVYKGKLEHEEVNGHSTIVVKKLDKSNGQGEKQYYNELQILHGYNHEKVVGLIGYSDETDEKLIVYEHASKGSLDKHLNNASITWRDRLKISIDVATGLNFLHQGIEGLGVVIHRDIKTANILLFDDWKAKLGDFGLSLISTTDKKAKFTIDHPCGTRDYVDPMYLQSGILTIESDVYSFGVALFEILCGRETYKLLKNKRQSLQSFSKQKFEDGKQDEVVFKGIKEEIVPKSLTTFLDIVYKCLDDDRKKRPTMKEILAQLEKAFQFQIQKIMF